MDIFKKKKLRRLTNRDEIRNAILTADDLKTEEVEVPEWEGIYIVKGLTGAQKDLYDASLIKTKGSNVTVSMRNARARLASMSIVDEKGNLVFSNADIVALTQKSALGLDRISEVAQRLSGISDDDIEELTENFDEGQSEGSISD